MTVIDYPGIIAIATSYPKNILTNEELSSRFPDWNPEKIELKTGIKSRFVADNTEFSSTLGYRAFQNLLVETGYLPEDVDFLIVVTQTPDFIFPGVSSFIHGAAGLRHDAGTMDVNLGCSGYVYGLSLAKGLIESGQVRNVVLITADTYSKLINSEDKSVVSIFGDGATATWIGPSKQKKMIAKAFFGSDGSRATSLFVPGGGLRSSNHEFPHADAANRGINSSGFDLYMDGPGIFSFTLEIAEEAIARTLALANLTKEEVDFFVFHQANAFMLRHLQAKLGLLDSKFPIEMSQWGNTVSGTIPMTLAEMKKKKKILSGEETTCLLLGFGVGLSWAGTVIKL